MCSLASSLSEAGWSDGTERSSADLRPRLPRCLPKHSATRRIPLPATPCQRCCSELAGRMEPSAAARLCSPVARIIADKIIAEPLCPQSSDVWDYPRASALSELAGRMEPSDAARLCGPLARVLVEAIGREKDTSAQACLTSALSELAGRMEPSEASAMLAAAIGRNVDTGLKIYVPTTLSAVAGRMDASESARICGPILKALAEEFNRQTDASPRDYLAEGLSREPAGLTGGGRQDLRPWPKFLQETLRIKRIIHPRPRDRAHGFQRTTRPPMQPHAHWDSVARSLPRKSRGESTLRGRTPSSLTHT